MRRYKNIFDIKIYFCILQTIPRIFKQAIKLYVKPVLILDLTCMKGAIISYGGSKRGAPFGPNFHAVFGKKIEP